MKIVILFNKLLWKFWYITFNYLMIGPIIINIQSFKEGVLNHDKTIVLLFLIVPLW